MARATAWSLSADSGYRDRAAKDSALVSTGAELRLANGVTLSGKFDGVSRLEPLAPFPLASLARFSRSIRQPGRASRCLHAGCRSVGLRTSTELIPEDGSPPGFDIT
jgi:hypothetical protein